MKFSDRFIDDQSLEKLYTTLQQLTTLRHFHLHFIGSPKAALSLIANCQRLRTISVFDRAFSEILQSNAARLEFLAFLMKQRDIWKGNMDMLNHRVGQYALQHPKRRIYFRANSGITSLERQKPANLKVINFPGKIN